MKQSLPQRAYTALADASAARIDTKAHNAFYERPATLAMLPEVAGRNILDPGCGPGVYTEWLLGRRPLFLESLQRSFRGSSLEAEKTSNTILFAP